MGRPAAGRVDCRAAADVQYDYVPLGRHRTQENSVKVKRKSLDIIFNSNEVGMIMSDKRLIRI